MFQKKNENETNQSENTVLYKTPEVLQSCLPKNTICISFRLIIGLSPCLLRPRGKQDAA